MRFLKSNIWSVALTAIVMLSVTGCNTDAITKNDSRISYINALDEQATFYAKKRAVVDNNSDSVYHSKYKVASLISGDYSDEIKHKWYLLDGSRFAVEDTNTRDKRVSIKKRLKDDRNYWLIAWLNAGDYELSLLRKSSSNRDGLYRVRVFANDSLAIYVDGSNSQLLTTKVGEVTDYFSVESCTGLIIEDNEIDLCTGDFNHSYLAVVDDSGLITLVEE
jgi:hypothetical protein